MTVYDWFSKNNIECSWDKILKMVEEYMENTKYDNLNDPEKTYGTYYAENGTVYNDSNSILDRVENQQKISNITISIDFE